MEIVYDETDLRRYFQTGQRVQRCAGVAGPLPDDAVEVDVDAICDGERVLIGGIMEHIEQAGVHPATPRVRCRRTPEPKFRT